MPLSSVLGLQIVISNIHEDELSHPMRIVQGLKILPKVLQHIKMLYHAFRDTITI